MAQISDKSTIPLKWAISAMSVITSIVALGAVWIFSVNVRLSRIEDKLGIKQYATEIVSTASAQERK